jgi:uncharacterized membrane protein YraQ (UPF0718 family)
MRRKKKMDIGVFILLAVTLGLLGFAFSRDAALPAAALRATGRLFGSVWIELALGFVLAGLVEVLVPSAVLVRWLGVERGSQGILIGWLAGLALPGGPYVLFPIMANLFAKGVGAGPLITLITAKTLVSPIRMLTYEAPLMGWPITLARFLPGMLMPPILGIVGQWLFELLARPRLPMGQ